MSIATEITRIQQAKADIKTAIEAKGVTVPSSATIDTYDEYVSQISGGGGGGMIRYTSGTPYCNGTNLVVDVHNEISVDSGTSWVESGSHYTVIVEVGGCGLPQGYTMVEYIQRNASNNGFVGLGEYFQVNTKIEIDFQMTQAKGNAIIGDYGSNDNDDWRVFLNYDSQVNNLMSYDFLRTRIQSNIGNWSKRFHIEIGNYYIKDLDSGSYIVQGTSKSSFTRPNQMYIFHMEGSQGSSNIDYGYIYGVKIWQGETLVKEFVPCKRDSDNAVGLYDRVNNEFHGSLNSTLVAGPIV